MRLFTGLPIDDKLRDAFPDLFEMPRDGIRVTAPGEMHITLQFVGDIEEQFADAFANELSAIRSNPFEIDLNGVGCFEGKSQHRILHINVQRSKPLLDLHDRIGQTMETVGLTREVRPYNPHVTLARVERLAAGAIAPFLQAHTQFLAALRIERFVLYRVHQHGETPHYERWFEYALSGE